MIDAAVVDASVALKWALEEPGSDRARLLSSARLEAPDLLPIECANVLWKKACTSLWRRSATCRW
jgi:predicted nucleic acid-binding protein